MKKSIWLYQNIFFRLLDFIRGRKTIKCLHLLRKSQFWEPEPMKSWQLSRLNALISNAKQYSPHMSEKLRDVKVPLEDVGEIANLPVLTKSETRDNYEKMRCTNIPWSECERRRTGGSTGEPTFYYLHKGSKDWNRASVYRSLEWTGVSLGEKTVQMTGSHIDHTTKRVLKFKLIDRIRRCEDMPVAKTDEQTLQNYYGQIMQWKPRSIWGYASGIYMFSKFIQDNYPGTYFGFIKSVVTSSETLLPHQRRLINNTFGPNKVFDHYGGSQMCIASECKGHRGYHIHAENIMLEVVSSSGEPLRNGELGRILVTDLSNMAFPFIRYEIGDMGIYDENTVCSCGIRLPLLDQVCGRISDMIVLDDRILTSPNITMLMSDIPGVESFQVKQYSRDGLEVNIVPDKAYNKTVEDYILGSIRKMTGEKVTLSIKYVNEIAVPESGKRRFVVSWQGI